MNRFLPLLLAALPVMFLTGCATAPKVPSSDQQARAAALNWLAIVDAGDYKKAYADRPPRILAGGNEESYIRNMRGRRAPLGRAKSRQFLRVTWSRTLSGAPDGLYEFVLFKTVFEHKALTYERLVLTPETGRWQVSGYSFE